MKKLSAKSVAVLSNLCLGVIIFVIAAVCFFPATIPVAKIDERANYRGKSQDSVSLMFNVYWGEGEVDGILDVLGEYGVKATFFLGGCWADDHVDTVKKIAQSGHEIGSHGYFHKEHDKLTYEGNLNEIKTSVDFLRLASGKEITLFAPPSGAYNENTLSAAQSLGLSTVLWSKDTVDWRDKEEELCFSRATQGVKGGDLILMHPMAHTLKALPNILEFYKKEGVKVIPVGENLRPQQNT